MFEHSRHARYAKLDENFVFGALASRPLSGKRVESLLFPGPIWPGVDAQARRYLDGHFDVPLFFAASGPVGCC